MEYVEHHLTALRFFNSKLARAQINQRIQSLRQKFLLFEFRSEQAIYVEHNHQSKRKAKKRRRGEENAENKAVWQIEESEERRVRADQYRYKQNCSNQRIFRVRNYANINGGR